MEIVQLTALNTAFDAALPTVDINDISPIQGGLTKGYEATITGFGYAEVAGNLTLTNAQTIRIPGQPDLVIPAGEKPLSLGFQFSDGSQIALSTLRRSALSSFNGKSSRSFTGVELKAMIGKKLKVVDVNKDASTARNNVRTNAAGEERTVENVGKAYVLTIS
jgi:hypothetical protein